MFNIFLHLSLQIYSISPLSSLLINHCLYIVNISEYLKPFRHLLFIISFISRINKLVKELNLLNNNILLFKQSKSFLK